MTDCSRPDFCDSASATSSSLVITPASGHDISEPHTQSGSIVHRIQKPKNVDLLNSPQQLRLQQLPPYLRSIMYQPQSTGKGPIQPHVSNLPRRKPRQRSVGALPKGSPTLGTLDAVKALSSASIRTNAARSPTPPRSSSSSFSESQPRGPEAYFVDDEPSPSVAPIYIKPSAPAFELGHVIPQSKGHIQPHITNMPRRRPRRPRSLLSRIETSTKQRKLRDRERWEKARYLQEVVKGSEVWVAFWDWENASEESDDEDQSDDSLAEELLRADRVIQIISREQEDQGYTEDSTVPTGDVDALKNVLKLFLSPQVVRVRDNGVPHTSLEQMSLARAFLSDILPRRTENSARATSTPTSSVPPTPRTASTPSLSRSSSSSTSPFPSSYSLTPSSTSSESRSNKRLLITVPSKEFAVDALALVVIAFSLLGDITSLATFADETESSVSPILEFLNRLNDLEGLDPHWRGALSCDGIDWLDGVLGLIKSSDGSNLEV
ncbi:hypothetical protein C8J55DRAFT_320777 [Lentinula edodes]|uniref:Uncharacterized protein n=1 Tax=Lentinula lateritia TaxID=40482 RepID=A0A9W9DW01_9AGAR|nr:hypothetical protein C8J55DRAFT_320777 [Lentinula edodes]